MFPKTYSTARGVLGFLSVVGWLLVILGILALVLSVLNAGQMTPALALSAIITGVVGLFLIASAQVSYAILDQADISRASLSILQAIAKEQGVGEIQELSNPTIGSSMEREPPITSKAVVRTDGSEVREYMGKEILKRDGRFFVSGTEFINLGKAKAAIKDGKI